MRAAAGAVPSTAGSTAVGAPAKASATAVPRGAAAATPKEEEGGAQAAAAAAAVATVLAAGPPPPHHRRGAWPRARARSSEPPDRQPLLLNCQSRDWRRRAKEVVPALKDAPRSTSTSALHRHRSVCDHDAGHGRAATPRTSEALERPGKKHKHANLPEILKKFYAWHFYLRITHEKALENIFAAL